MNSQICRVLLVAVVLLGGAAAQDDGAEAIAQPVRYGRDIRPILSDRCFKCHGPDAATRQADLRLDVREQAIADRDGEAAIVPGSAEQSLLWQRVQSHDDDDRMPPPDSGKLALQPHELALLERWLDDGAEYEPHWAFVPPVRPEVPAAGDDVTHPIDAFLRTAQRAQAIAPSPAADRETLLRRLFLVLTGLPPTPSELAAFAADTSPDAYERQVDRLLEEEPYATRHAEHLAAMWLDAGRYADTSGIHMDAGRQAWLWRDWLIEALRTDKPFDEFVVEQLAGDLLPEPTPQQQIATGFLRNHVTTDEGGAINAEYLVEYAAERTATVGSVFLGLTVGCARCHDHKFDPIRQQDYFRLFSFFNNNQEPGLYSQARDANRALEPFMAVPTPTQTEQKQQLQQQIAAAELTIARTSPDEQRSYSSFLAERTAEHGLVWQRPVVMAAESANGATMSIGIDGSVLVSGESPPHDTHTMLLQTSAPRQRWLAIEALTDDSLPGGRVGRASHGNVVLQHVRLEERPVGHDGEWREVPLCYALADVEQDNGDFVVGNLLTDDGHGWAPAGHQGNPGPRTAMLLAARPFGDDGGSELRVTLKYDSSYNQHVFGRVRFATSPATERGIARLPVATSGFHVVGPLQAADVATHYDTAFGPEAIGRLDRDAQFGKQSWRFDQKLDRDARHPLPAGQNVHYVAQRLWLPDNRTIEVGIGSDDGWQLFLDGRPVGERRVDRAVDLDQDRQRLELDAGPHLLVLKIVNTGGVGGFALRALARDGELPRDLCLLLLPAGAATSGSVGDRITAAYRNHYSPQHKVRVEQLAELRAELQAIEAAVPRAMVMQERAEMRPTFVLTRGEYDKADPERPVQRELPQLFGELPADLPRNRLGLARWLVSDQNPLLRRVAVNRLWEFVFGTGIVRTSEDFGYQGEWPSHPELLDWLAVEFADNGQSVRAMLRLLVTSAAFRQQSRVGAGQTKDPDNRLLTWFPRRRLSAESIRDQALYVAGLLVERPGGPSVKPYQPPGLWREVAMLQSNTRIFERGGGDDLWRRSLYTYWKRACPPPNLLTFDAPTREFCTIRRSTTNTPLQALVLWNDDQFVEAARLLARRTLREHHGDDARLAAMYRRATGHTLLPDQAALARATLREMQRRYHADPDAATALLGVGEARRSDDLPAPDLAAFTMLASAFLDLDATLYID